MNDAAINELLVKLPPDILNEFSVHYKAPAVPASAHSLELESETCLGTISVWTSGMMDWHIFDIETSTEALLGCRENLDLNTVRDTILAIFDEVKKRDKINPRANQ